jgi:hypothetical protein
MRRHRPVSFLVGLVIAAALSVAAGTAGAGLSETPVETACPAGYDRLTVNSLEAQGPYILPRLVDTAGNNNGYVCGLALPDAVRDAVCRTVGGTPCTLQQLGLPVYDFRDDDNPASG